MRFLVPALLATGITAWASVARCDDVADVKAAEMAAGAAATNGNFEEQFKFFLPDRTLFGVNGGSLIVGWTEETKKRRRAAFEAEVKSGTRNDVKTEDMKVQVFGNTAIATYYRVATTTEPNQPPKLSRVRVTGVWVRQPDGWKLAHRHESPF